MDEEPPPQAPQAPFPELKLPYYEHYDTRIEITPEYASKIKDRMLSKFCYNLTEEINEFIKLITYNEETGHEFQKYYRNLLTKMYVYFKHLRFKGTELSPLSFMELRMLKFFDGNQGNCIFDKLVILTNDEKYTGVDPGEGVLDLVINDIDLEELKKLINTCEKNVIMLVGIHKWEGRHRNLLILSKNGIEIIEPNYNSEYEQSNELSGYREFAEKLGLPIKYKKIECLKHHGGMCTLMATLNFYYPSYFDFPFARQKVAEYLLWELDNINKCVLSFGKSKINFKFKDVILDIKYLLK